MPECPRIILSISSLSYMIKNAKHEIQNPIARQLAWSAGLAGVIDPPLHLVFWGKFLTPPKRWAIKMALGRGKGFYNPELGFQSKTNGELTNGQWVAPSGVMLLELSETCLTPPWGFEDQTGTIWGMSQILAPPTLWIIMIFPSRPHLRSTPSRVVDWWRAPPSLKAQCCGGLLDAQLNQAENATLFFFFFKYVFMDFYCFWTRNGHMQRPRTKFFPPFGGLFKANHVQSAILDPWWGQFSLVLTLEPRSCSPVWAGQGEGCLGAITAGLHCFPQRLVHDYL